MAKDAIIEAPKFELAPMDMGPEELADLVTANIGDDDLDAFDLPRAVNPSDKATDWSIEGLDEKPETVDTIEGVIIHHRTIRAYWEKEYSGSGGPPDCSSIDARQGVGTPGGKCADCPLTAFGSGKNNSQACRIIKQLFMIREGEILPTTVNITAVNVKIPKKYMLDLLSKKRKKFNRVITKITNVTDKSNSGFNYAKTIFSVSGVLSPEQSAAMETMTQLMAPILGARAVVLDVTPDDAREPGSDDDAEATYTEPEDF